MKLVSNIHGNGVVATYVVTLMTMMTMHDDHATTPYNGAVAPSVMMVLWHHITAIRLNTRDVCFGYGGKGT